MKEKYREKTRRPRNDPAVKNSSLLASKASRVLFWLLPKPHISGIREDEIHWPCLGNVDISAPASILLPDRNEDQGKDRL